MGERRERLEEERSGGNWVHAFTQKKKQTRQRNPKSVGVSVKKLVNKIHSLAWKCAKVVGCSGGGSVEVVGNLKP